MGKSQVLKMGKYRQLVGECPECSGVTMFDKRSEIICQNCGLVIFRPGNDQVAVYIGNNTPMIYEKEEFKIPQNMHIASVGERVGLSMVELKWNEADLL